MPAIYLVVQHTDGMVEGSLCTVPTCADNRQRDITERDRFKDSATPKSEVQFEVSEVRSVAVMSEINTALRSPSV